MKIQKFNMALVAVLSLSTSIVSASLQQEKDIANSTVVSSRSGTYNSHLTQKKREILDDHLNKRETYPGYLEMAKNVLKSLSTETIAAKTSWNFISIIDAQYVETEKGLLLREISEQSDTQ